MAATPLPEEGGRRLRRRRVLVRAIAAVPPPQPPSSLPASTPYCAHRSAVSASASRPCIRCCRQSPAFRGRERNTRGGQSRVLSAQGEREKGWVLPRSSTTRRESTRRDSTRRQGQADAATRGASRASRQGPARRKVGSKEAHLTSPSRRLLCHFLELSSESAKRQPPGRPVAGR